MRVFCNETVSSYLSKVGTALGEVVEAVVQGAATALAAFLMLVTVVHLGPVFLAAIVGAPAWALILHVFN